MAESESEPWLSVNPTYTEINVQSAIADPASILFTYKQLIALRKNHPVMVYGDYHPVIQAFYESKEGQKEFRGILKNWDKERIEIETVEGLRETFLRSDLSLIRLAYDFE